MELTKRLGEAASTAILLIRSLTDLVISVVLGVNRTSPAVFVLPLLLILEIGGGFHLIVCFECLDCLKRGELVMLVSVLIVDC